MLLFHQQQAGQWSALAESIDTYMESVRELAERMAVDGEGGGFLWGGGRGRGCFGERGFGGGVERPAEGRRGLFWGEGVRGTGSRCGDAVGDPGRWQQQGVVRQHHLCCSAVALVQQQQ